MQDIEVQIQGLKSNVIVDFGTPALSFVCVCVCDDKDMFVIYFIYIP